MLEGTTKKTFLLLLLLFFIDLTKFKTKYTHFSFFVDILHPI